MKYASKCKSKGKPDMYGQVSTASYPAVPQKGAPSVDKSVMTAGKAMGGEAERVASNSGKMVDNTFASINMDVSYSKTPNKG